jgi:hypothetical protein
MVTSIFELYCRFKSSDACLHIKDDLYNVISVTLMIIGRYFGCNC